MLAERPETDHAISFALKESGYLELWKIETERHPWRYAHGLIDKLQLPSDAVREYCIDTVKEAYSGGVRFAVNLVQLTLLHQQYPRESFQLEVDLYETLVRNDQNRREVAFEWLKKHYPEQLELHMEQIQPHTPYWWSLIDRVEPKLAAISRNAVASEGSADVCTTCGDHPAYQYRLVNSAETMPGVPSLRLCEDCIQIRRDMGNVLTPFYSENC